ncbi:MAG: host-nuclease inhibitor Gam family protein [Burkholderiales bacterium]|nr:host-nuclease inhibitor Gam family protein [Burkholderiales bacterium]
MAAKHRLKSTAAAYAPQSKEDCIADVKRLGDAQRELTRRTADMNDEIAAITKRYSERLEALQAQVETLQRGIQTWCEAHRAELTDGGKVKSANLITGEVSWRQRPPSVSVRNAEGVIETLKRLGLVRFVRVKEEVNKEAVLEEPDAARGVAGLTIVTGVEDFAITPFEQEVQA